MCKWTYPVFPYVYLVLVYHADISSWWVGTHLNIFPTFKQSNNNSTDKKSVFDLKIIFITEEFAHMYTKSNKQGKLWGFSIDLSTYM